MNCQSRIMRRKNDFLLQTQQLGKYLTYTAWCKAEPYLEFWPNRACFYSMMVLAGWTISVSFRISLREHWTPTLSRQLLFEAKEHTSTTLVKMFYLLQLFLPDWSFFQHQAPQISTPLPTPTQPPPNPTRWPPSSTRETRTSKVCVFSEIELWSSSFLNIPA